MWRMNKNFMAGERFVEERTICEGCCKSGREQAYSKTWRSHGTAILWAMLMTVASQSWAAPNAITFFVATNGNDGWSGKLSEPNGKKTDGPFATIQKGLEASRAMRKTEGGKVAPVITIREGTHFLTNTVIIKPEDSGLTMSAYRKEKPVISGGIELKGWSEIAGASNHLMKAAAPKLTGTNLFFREL